MTRKKAQQKTRGFRRTFKERRYVIVWRPVDQSGEVMEGPDDFVSVQLGRPLTPKDFHNGKLLSIARVYRRKNTLVTRLFLSREAAEVLSDLLRHTLKLRPSLRARVIDVSQGISKALFVEAVLQSRALDRD